MCQSVHNFVFANTTFLFCPSFFLSRITDTGMIDRLQLLNEHRLGILDVAEGHWAFAEVAFSHLRVDKTFHQVANALFRIVGQRTGGRLNRIGHHQTCLFTGKGVGTGIGEQQVVDGFVGEVVLLLHVEVLGLTQTVVGGNEVADYLRQIQELVFLREYLMHTLLLKSICWIPVRLF